MSTSLQTIEQISSRIEQLVQLNIQLKEKNRQLAANNSQMQGSLKDLESKMEEMEEKYNALKLAKSLSGDNEKSLDTKRKIDDFVSEIDKCIALLNS